MADKKLPISVVISAVDNVTYRVMAINEKIKRMTAPVGKVQAAFKTLGDEAGIGKLASSIGKVGSTGKEFFNELSGAIFKVGAVGIGAAASIFELTKSFAESGDNIAMLSRRLGLTTDSYQELAYAAKKANIPQEEFDGAMTKFSKNIAEAAAGSGDAMIGFNALRISVRDSSGHLKKLDDILPTVAEKLSQIKNQNLRNAVAAKLFGKEGAKLNDLFKDGAKGLEDMRKEAHKVGAVMTPDQIKAASEFDDGMKSVGSTLLMVRNIIGAALAPKILELAQKLQKFILDKKDQITAWASAFADKLPGFIDKAISALETFGSVVSKVISVISGLSDIFGPTAVAVAALLIYFAPLVASAVSLAAAIGGVLVPALTVAWTFFSLVGSVLATLATVLIGLVGWPIALGAAFVGAALLIWKYWEPLTKLLSETWDKVKGFFGGTTQINGNLTTTAAGPSLGPAMGFSKTVDASDRVEQNKSLNHVVVDFNNIPQGTQVETKKSEGLLDLNMGYAH